MAHVDTTGFCNRRMVDVMKVKTHLLSFVLQGSILTAFFCKNPQTFPISEYIIERNAYCLSYNGEHRQARWVYEYLTEDKIQGEVKRSGFFFKEDPEIPLIFRVSDKDFTGSGFDRGHLCPAADAVASEEAMKETFYFSNVSPKVPQFNRGYWAKIEKHIRELTKEYKALNVYTGPLFLPQADRTDGKRYVKYQVIGDNDVAVPTHFFKLIIAEKKEGGTERMAYILPNMLIDKRTPLEQFKVAIEKVEKASGLVFPP